MRNDGQTLLDDKQIEMFAKSHQALAWCTYTGPFFPGSSINNQFVRLLYRHAGGELRTVEFSRMATVESRQLVHVAGTEAPITMREFEDLYGHNEITWRT